MQSVDGSMFKVREGATTESEGEVKMTKTTKTVEELIETGESPLPLDVLPNHMGINLCSVKSLTWTRLDDGQLVDLTINFIPAEEEEEDCSKDSDPRSKIRESMADSPQFIFEKKTASKEKKVGGQENEEKIKKALGALISPNERTFEGAMDLGQLEELEEDQVLIWVNENNISLQSGKMGGPWIASDSDGNEGRGHSVFAAVNNLRVRTLFKAKRMLERLDLFGSKKVSKS